MKFEIPFGAYTNSKGVLQVPFIRLPVIIALVVLAAVFLMLRYTKFGRSLYAVGGNEQSATMMGLNVKMTKLKAYMLSSFLCSVGGICFCMNTMSGRLYYWRLHHPGDYNHPLCAGGFLRRGAGVQGCYRYYHCNYSGAAF